MKREEKKKCAFEEDYEGCFISLQRLSPPCAAGSNSPATPVGCRKNRERAEGSSVGEGEREPTVWEGREARVCEGRRRWLYMYNLGKNYN